MNKCKYNMDIKVDTSNFPGLVSDLCKCLVKKSSKDDNIININKLRSTSFEILLEKHPIIYLKKDKRKNNKVIDPVGELFKYSFVLKTTCGSNSRAKQLEDLLDQLIEDEGDSNPVILSVLQFLNCLKSYQSSEINDMDIFYFNEKHPALPEVYQHEKQVPHYPVFPMSAFVFPTKMNSLISINEHSYTKINVKSPFNFFSDLKTEINNNEFCMTSSLTTCSLEPLQMSQEFITNNVEYSWVPEEENECENIDTDQEQLMWSDINTDDLSDKSEKKSWEFLGQIEPPQPQFITESKFAMDYLQNSKYFPIFSDQIIKSDKEPYKVLDRKEFIENMKLVLLGIESEYFVWREKFGFIFKDNISIIGFTKDALNNICTEIINWATSFKILSSLARPKFETEKLRQDDLIYKAMCSSIEELLIHYQASVFNIFSHSNDENLLSLMHSLKNIGSLISQVAKLCHCEQIKQAALGEGIGILSHIYNEITKITKPNIALVYYSILKSCCDVYFQLLEKWIFEGICDETYSEFMIKIRGQYLRIRGHKFWAKCFGINKAAVPGFLKNITDLILQCGKAVRLLKICDPKNALCNLFITARPQMKVCLSVNILSEQEKICQEYMNKGIEILGSNVTIRKALEEMKEGEKINAERVVAAQLNTIQRIKKSQEDAKIQLVKNKKILLEEQKKEVADAILRKEKAKEAQLLEEKMFAEMNLAEQEKMKAEKIAETKIVIEYYKDLAKEAKRRKLRADWRKKRMALFDNRLESIMLVHREEKTPSEELIQNKIINKSKIEINDDKTKELTKRYRPTILPIKLTTNMNIDELTNDTDIDTEIILNELTKKKKLLIKNINDIKKIDEETFLNKNSMSITILDKEGNENAIITIDENKNRKNVEINQVDNPNLAIIREESCQQILNDDTTPMSCTTDSYIHSTMSNSIYYNGTEAGSSRDSKNDFETPSTPIDYLDRHLIKRGLSIDSIFSRSNSQFFNAFSLTESPSIFESALTTADVEIIDNTTLQVYLEKSVLMPLRVQSHLANCAVVKFLLYNHKILSHLRSLRSFFFLLNGEFAKNLTGPLFSKFYDISLPGELFNSATLTNLLKNALHCSLNNSYTNSELLSLSVMEQPSRLDILDPEALNCLCLHYKVFWPLNIILDEGVMQQYSKVFKLLLMIGRVLWVLQENFTILKNERKAAMSFQYHRLQLFRYAMMQFMIALHNYITCSVLHASWAEFEKELANAKTLDQIYTTHISYIKKILSRCMLTNRAEKLRKCLCNTFQIILKFHSTLRSKEWQLTPSGYIHPNYSKLQKMYDSFCTMRTYPSQVVDKYASTGYQMHLTHFLDALNINPLYTL